MMHWWNNQLFLVFSFQIMIACRKLWSNGIHCGAIYTILYSHFAFLNNFSQTIADCFWIISFKVGEYKWLQIHCTISIYSNCFHKIYSYNCPVRKLHISCKFIVIEKEAKQRVMPTKQLMLWWWWEQQNVYLLIINHERNFTQKNKIKAWYEW